MKRFLAPVVFAIWASTLILAQQPFVSQIFTAAWTTSTTAGASGTGAVLQAPTAGFNTALVTFVDTTTLTQGVATFEGSDTPDNTVRDNWFSIPCAAPTTATSNYAFQASTNIAFQCNVVGFQRFRTRLSTTILGTGTVTQSLQFVSLGAAALASLPSGTATLGAISNLPATVTLNQGAADASTLRSAVSNLPTTVDTNQGAAGASTLRSAVSNLPTTVDTNQGAAGASTLRAAVSNLPTTVDTNTGAAGASTPRVVISSDGVKATNFPTTVTLNQGAADASTLRAAVSNLPTTADTNNGAAGASTLRTAVAPNTAASPFNIQANTAVNAAGRISRTYLGFNSTNTAKTTTLTLSQAMVAGDTMVVIAFSGNYNSANWSGVVTDSASHTCTQIAFGINSTTQFAGAYVCPNETAVTTAIFTISGSNSANTTTGLVAYDVANVGTLLADVVDTSYWGGASSGTAIALNTAISNSVANSLVIGGTCAAGTVSAGGTNYVADSGVQAPASAAGCVNMDAQSAILPGFQAVTMPFTQGSAAFADIAIILKPITQTTDGLPKINGSTAGCVNAGGADGSGNLGGCNVSGLLTEKNFRFSKGSNPGSAATASVVVNNTAQTGRISVIDCIFYALASDGTAVGANATVNITIAGSSQGTVFTKALAYSTTTGLVYVDNNVCGLNLPTIGAETWTVAFSGNTAHLLESVNVTGYNLAQTLTY